MTDWLTIDTAPKDGTLILIYRHGWDCAPVASWVDYPGVFVLDANENEVTMQGWLFDEAIILGEESGWLGWSEDTMPSHWMPLPA